MTAPKDAAGAIAAGLDVAGLIARADVVEAPPQPSGPAPAPHPGDAADQSDTIAGGPCEMDGRLCVMAIEDYLARPELLEPPAVVVPCLAWQGRLTLLIGDEKSGKSTLTGQAVAALRNGGLFLDEPVEPGAVLWLALDESRADAVRRLAALGVADGVVFEPFDGPRAVQLPAEDRQVPSGARLTSVIEQRAIRLVVIDTINQYATQKDGGFEINQAEGWLRLFRELRGVAERTGAAFLMLDHANRSAGEPGAGRRYNGNVAKGASVDALVDFTVTKGDPAARKLTVRGRGVHDDVTLDFAHGLYARRGAAGERDDIGDIRAMVLVAVRVLADAGSDGLTATQWQRQYQEDAARAGVPRSQRSFYRALAASVRQGFVLQQAKLKRYVVLDRGERQIQEAA